MDKKETGPFPPVCVGSYTVGMNVYRGKSSRCINVEGAMGWDNAKMDSTPSKYAYTKEASETKQKERRVEAEFLQWETRTCEVAA